MKDKKKTFLLLLCNIIPALAGLLSFQGGFISDVLVILLTPLPISLNFMLAGKIKIMILWDIIFLILSGTEIIFSCYLYQWNVASDKEGFLVTWLFFMIWLALSIFLILGSLLCSFIIRKKRVPALFTAGILLLDIILSCSYVYMTIVPGAYENTAVIISSGGDYTCNGSYEGWINDNDSVVIRNRKSGKKKKYAEAFWGICPEQIALGNQHFYVMGEDDLGCFIVKTDYAGNIIARRKMKSIDRIGCQNGVLLLFTDNLLSADDFMAETPFSFPVNKYLPEADFETGEPIRCKSDGNGICQIGDLKLYDHGKYFSSNPVLPFYQGTDCYTIDARETAEQTEQSRWRECVKLMLQEKGLSGYNCEINEYQNGNDIYGIARIREAILGIEDRKLKKSIAYKISGKTGELSILAEKSNVFIIISSDDSLTYLDHNKIMQEELSTGKTDHLGTVISSSEENFIINGAYFSFLNSDKEQKWICWTRSDSKLPDMKE